MGGSDRSALYGGRRPRWEAKLRRAMALIEEVREDLWEGLGADGQYDNAADDGALREKLGLAVRFIREELPPKKEEDPSRLY